MIVKDILGRTVKVGNLVAAATISFKKANLRFGRVKSISDSGNLSITLIPEPTNKYDAPQVICKLGKFVVVDGLEDWVNTTKD